LEIADDLNCMQRQVLMSFTAVFQKVPEGFIGFIEELPGANTQGDTIEQVRENLHEAASLIIETNRLLAEEDIVGRDVIRESFEIAV
jgi:predicted RNase H-like HicB family nuclease